MGQSTWGHSQGAMKNLHAATTVKIPEGVTVDIKSRAVVVKGPRGTLSKSFKHMQIDLFKPAENIIKIEKWFSLSKEQSAIKTCSSHIQNMIIGVTKGFKYRMKMVYAHFPTNAQISGDGKSVPWLTSLARRSSSTLMPTKGSRSSAILRLTQSFSSVATTLSLSPRPVHSSTRVAQ